MPATGSSSRCPRGRDSMRTKRARPSERQCTRPRPGLRTPTRANPTIRRSATAPFSYVPSTRPHLSFCVRARRHSGRSPLHPLYESNRERFPVSLLSPNTPLLVGADERATGRDTVPRLFLLVPSRNALSRASKSTLPRKGPEQSAGPGHAAHLRAMGYGSYRVRGMSLAGQERTLANLFRKRTFRVLMTRPTAGPGAPIWRRQGPW